MRHLIFISINPFCSDNLSLHWEKWNGSSSECQCLVYPKQYKRRLSPFALHFIAQFLWLRASICFWRQENNFFFLRDHSLSSECFNFLWKNLKLRDYTVRIAWCLLKWTLRKFKDHKINKKILVPFYVNKSLSTDFKMQPASAEQHKWLH